ncbi:Sphingolipid C4-hydroxylase sur2 [Schizosaccharomyces pombe]|uniref:Sphingolipid C4-hydroxylase sur2 n=1 Tax=Schizosaccharomyces pombe (strain 972 / ATCC 24843) TaxID=284812 RepID=SUR2_SCHPO|nr:sphingosine hydroxylase Sur2 [Schizosaccharomyces pombe]O94298.1 RecName: Full=Sphingolipid C4-hydroxylase sur2; AltName: Full=Syringomycin response protein 2 [Schizosaccharomyces pombe 972h-]CAA21900.1 sphingosine hydroxylase Sur2 [Schizosaccharomyces pombe]|eukprot:NP_596489.1 sphingosine hydroxylase Sur2 [Schizosaccharomyces pombe]
MVTTVEMLTTWNPVTVSLVSPVIIYWVASAFFGFLHYIELPVFEKYRIHPPEEIARRNRVPQMAVVKAVLFQQLCEVVVGIALAMFEGYPEPIDEAKQMLRYEAFFSKNLPALLQVAPFAPKLAYNFIVPAFQYFFAFFIIDSWQYFWHRYLHYNKKLYNMIHAHHHRLQVPYAMGALYNHPFEGLILDTFGAGVAYLAAGLSPQQAVIFFTLSTLKTVDDHCGYVFPYDPLQMFFANNARYHDLHHQPYGFQKNFSQPFFTFWDHVLGTYMPPKSETPYEKKQKAKNAKKVN